MSTAQQEYIDAGVFAINKLKDYRQSYVEVMNLKYGVRDELLNTWLTGIAGQPSSVVQKIQEVLAEFDAVRKYGTPYPDGNADTTWMVGMKQSALYIIQLIEDLVYSNEYDPRYRDANKRKLRVIDFLDYESIRGRMVECVDLVRSERQAASADVAVPADGQTATPTATSTGVAGTAATDDADTEKGFFSLPQPDQVQWDKQNEKLMKTYVQLIPDQKSQKDLEAMI